MKLAQRGGNRPSRFAETKAGPNGPAFSIDAAADACRKPATVAGFISYCRVRTLVGKGYEATPPDSPEWCGRIYELEPA